VATFDSVNMEQLVASDPDLVLAAGNGLNKPADIARIRERGDIVAFLYPEDVPGVLDDIQLIGDAIGKGDDAEAMTSAMQARIDDISAAAAAVPQPRTFYELGADPELYGPTDDSFVADMITLAGGEPITTGSPTVSSLSLERLVDQDPEVIVLGDSHAMGWGVEQRRATGLERHDAVKSVPSGRSTTSSSRDPAHGWATAGGPGHGHPTSSCPARRRDSAQASDAADRGSMSAGAATDARPALRSAARGRRHRPVAVGLGALAALGGHRGRRRLRQHRRARR
jgi:hypothetical protein